MRIMSKDTIRCAWANPKNPLYIEYHDTEWGVPVYDDRTLFEFIVLESAQAGLSWETILNRRAGYRKAFKNFNPKVVAKFDEKDVARFMNDARIIRNRLKIKAAITNAQSFLNIQKECGSFSKYLWQWMELKEEPQEIGRLLAKDMKKRGFTFFGTVTCFAYMQAVGLVDDHSESCFKYTKSKVKR